MAVYIMNIIAVYFISMYANNQNEEFIDPTIKTKRLKNANKIICVIWVLIFALRYRTGTDQMAYRREYLELCSKEHDLSFLLLYQRDVLYTILEYVIGRFTNGDFQILNAVVALLIYCPFLYVARNESVDYPSTVLLYIFTLNFYSGMNGTRQAIASSFLLLAYYCCYKKKKHIPYLLLVLIAFGFHSSSIFAVPFHLFSRKKAKSISTLVIFACMFAAFFVLPSLWESVINGLSFIGQSKMASDYIALNLADGATYLRFFVCLSPVLLGWLYFDRLKCYYADTDAEYILVWCHAIVMLFSTKSWLFARLAGCIGYVVPFYISKLGVVFSEENRSKGMTAILILYFIYMLLLLYHGESDLYPYRSVITYGTSW